MYMCILCFLRAFMELSLTHVITLAAMIMCKDFLYSFFCLIFLFLVCRLLFSSTFCFYFSFLTYDFFFSFSIFSTQRDLHFLTNLARFPFKLSTVGKFFVLTFSFVPSPPRISWSAQACEYCDFINNPATIADLCQNGVNLVQHLRKFTFNVFSSMLANEISQGNTHIIQLI